MWKNWRQLVQGAQKTKKTEEQKGTEILSPSAHVPAHVAIIMDGNGRWAKERSLPRIMGHRQGMQTVKRIVRKADAMGIKILTLYAFSTENWKRPKDEVDYLMSLPQEYLATELDELIQRNVQIRMVGKEERIPSSTLEAIVTAREKTKENTGLILNFALNYGGRNEIIDAVQQIATLIQDKQLTIDEITEENFSRFLYTANLPDPDLLIRTSGELRISNFMLWQLAYTELWFTDCYWPDFTEDDLEEAVRAYQGRSRRFGAITGGRS